MQHPVMDYHALEDQTLPNQFSPWNDQSSATANIDAQKGLTYVHETQDNQPNQNQNQVIDKQIVDIDADSNNQADVHIAHGRLKSVATPTTIATDSPGYLESDESNEQQYVVPADLNHAPASMIFTGADEDVSVPEHTACKSIPDSSDSDVEGVATPLLTDEAKVSPGPSDISMPSSEDMSSLISKLSTLREQNKINEVLEVLQKSGLLEAIENKKEQKPPTGEKALETTPRQDAQNKCPKCDKGFPRPCELKYVPRQE